MLAPEPLYACPGEEASAKRSVSIWTRFSWVSIIMVSIQYILRFTLLNDYATVDTITSPSSAILAIAKPSYDIDNRSML